MTTHANLTGANLHELKGAAAAAASTVPVADGAGSSAFAKLTTASLDTASIFDTNKYTLSGQMADVSAPSTYYFVIPRASTLNKVWTILQSAIITADSILTVKNHAGTTIGTITVAFSGAAAGDVDSLTASSNNTFTAGQMCQITTDGGSSTTAILGIVLDLTQTA